MIKLNKMSEVKTDKEIIETELNVPFSPIDARVLVKPLEEVKVVKKILVPTDEKVEEDIQDTKEVEEEVVSNLRVGVVLSVDSATEFPFSIGDKVVFVYRAAMPFDLYKDTVLLKRYDILGLWQK
jgi:co-chaperonin GroES (HSP10)